MVTVTGYDLVERVDGRRGVGRSEHATQRPCEPDLGDERDAASGVAGNRRPVPEDEPPAFVPRFFAHGRKQSAGLIIGERQQRQLLASVEPGDDTRRPPAELSGTRIEQNRTRKRRDRHVLGVHVSSHRKSLRRRRFTVRRLQGGDSLSAPC